jgi:signal transduction histidine kinase
MAHANGSVEPKVISYIGTCCDMVTDVGEYLPLLTGYAEQEFLGRDINEILYGLLRCTGDIGYSATLSDCFLFTASLQAVRVNIRVWRGNRPDEEKHMIVTIPRGGLDLLFPFANQLIADDKIGLGIFCARTLILLKANAAFLDFFKKPMNKPENVIGRAMGTIMDGFAGSELEKAWKSIISSGKSIYISEFPGESNGFKNRYINELIIPILLAEDARYIVFVFQDVTQAVLNRLHIEEQNAAIQAINEQLKKEMEAKDQYHSLLTHEFKTPLSVIHSAVQMLEMTCRDVMPEKARVYLNYIKQNTFRQMRLVNNLLDVARLKEGRIKISKRKTDVVSLARQITESVRLYAGQKRQSLRFDSSSESMAMQIDDEKLERILLNLLSNAMKFTPEGKAITVSVGFPRQDTLRLAVRDEGVGIPEDKLGEIFERFGQVGNSLTRQSEGTGIGLTLVKLLVEALGGRITVQSAVGSGSVFTVELPVEKHPAQEEKPHTDDADLNERITQSVSIEFSDIYFQTEA